MMSLALTAQNAPRTGGELRFWLILPTNVSSEAVQIRYFSSGKYGGLGSFLTAKPDMSRYELSVPKTTSEVRVIAYLPGCQFQTLVLTPGMPEDQRLECRPLRTVELGGRIESKAFLAGKSFDVEAWYLARWDHEFFRIADGAVSQFTLAKVKPDKDGSFKMVLPNFAEDAVTGQWRMKGTWQLFLREIGTGNILGSLHPKQFSSPGFELEVRPSYPEVVFFAVTEW